MKCAQAIKDRRRQRLRLYRQLAA